MPSKKDIVKNGQEQVSVNTDALFNKVSAIIEEGRKYVSTAINLAEVYSKFQIGMYIVEDEQAGNKRAGYGKQVLLNLSERLTEKYGDGWSVEQLTLIRKFYTVYSNSVNADYEIQNTDLEITESAPVKIVNTVYQIQNLPKSIDPSSMPRFTLSWSHYIVLMRIKNEEERQFYEIEALREHWSVRHLQRQYASKPDSTYTEKKLENKIISSIQKFLLELGKGFLFETRQKCLVFDEEFFYVDLVCYNRLLQCYVLIDLKMDKLTHQDLGQMQMYVNYYDRFVKQDFEKPTIGILLCKSKKDSLVELTLPKDANIYASEYALYLPDKKELQQKLKEWTEEFENQ